VCDEACPHRKEAAILRSERGYWQAMHAGALERVEEQRREFVAKAELARQEAAERQARLLAVIAALKAQLGELRQQVFGSRSERGRSAHEGQGGTGRRRGQRPGAPGHGKRQRPELPVVEQMRELAESERRCAKCGLERKRLASTEDSEQIEIEVKAHRRLIRRARYVKTCECPETSAIVVAPKEPKLVARGRYGTSVWVMALVQKFWHQVPTARLLEQLGDRGLSIAPGTLTDGMKRLAPLFAPVVAALRERLVQSSHWHADETTWRVFQELAGKSSNRWFLWMFMSREVVLFTLDPSRSARVPLAVLEGARGVLSTDRYGAYKVVAGRLPIKNSWCWTHQRRDFVKMAQFRPELRTWGLARVEEIAQLYRLNDARLAASPGAEVPMPTCEQRLLEAHVEHMRGEVARQLADPATVAPARKVLRSMQRHWEGLVLFVSHPWIPLDNNSAEREVRRPVAGRKGYYGSGAIWSGHLAAALFSIFHTLHLWGLSPHAWLTTYLGACAAGGGRAPADIGAFLPWNLTPEQRRALSAPTGAARGGDGVVDEILRPPVHRPRARGDPDDHPRRGHARADLPTGVPDAAVAQA